MDSRNIRIVLSIEKIYTNDDGVDMLTKTLPKEKQVYASRNVRLLGSFRLVHVL